METGRNIQPLGGWDYDFKVYVATVIQHQAFTVKPTGIREEPIAESSFLQKFTYDPTTLQLTVTMKTGAEYVHFMVYPQMFEELMQSKSKGSYYARVIKAQGNSSRIINKNIGQRTLKTPIVRTMARTQQNGRTHV